MQQMRGVPARQRTALGNGGGTCDVLARIRGRTPVIDPSLNETYVRLGYRHAPPRQRWELFAIEWELAAQATHQAGRGAASDLPRWIRRAMTGIFCGRCRPRRGRRRRSDHALAID